MAETKYGKYVLKHAVEKFEDGQRLHMVGEKDFNTNYCLGFGVIKKPGIIEEAAHSHNFDMYAHFIPLDPDNIRDLEAEVEFYLGEEGEKHIITTSTSVYVPKGLVHSPVIVKKLNKPFLFVHSVMAPKYTK
jgi:hypothetical protein